MRGEELREFLVGLESLFPDFNASSSSKHIIDAVERDSRGKELSFYEIVSLLNVLSGHGSFSDYGHGGETTSENFTHNHEFLLQQIRDLEDQIVKKGEELHSYQRELERMRLNLAASEKQIQESLEKLVSYVPKLLNALQIVDKDRNELYQLHLEVMHGGRIANREITRRAGLEKELGKIYNELVDIGSTTDHDGSNYMEETVMAKPLPFVFYSIVLWLLGGLITFVVRDYINQSDLLLRFPSYSIY